MNSCLGKSKIFLLNNSNDAMNLLCNNSLQAHTIYIQEIELKARLFVSLKYSCWGAEGLQ